jgi:hypothetical protein
MDDGGDVGSILNEIATVLLPRIEKRWGVPTYFEKWLLGLRERSLAGDELQGSSIARLNEAKELVLRSQRFVTYAERRTSTAGLPSTGVDPFTFLMSQGVNEPAQWAGGPLMKSVYDIALYMILIGEMCPGTIVELGTGAGYSAIFLRDVAQSGGRPVAVITMDRVEPFVSVPNISYKLSDLEHPAKALSSVLSSSPKRPVLVIDDAHVSTTELIETFVDHATAGDYLVLEDSVNKHQAIAESRAVRESLLVLDTRYLDYFGRNSTSAMDSIFTFAPSLQMSQPNEAT